MPQILGIDALRRLPPSSQAQLPARARLRAEALALVEAEGLGLAAASYRFVPLERTEAGGVLCVDGEELPAPWLLPASGELTAVACAVCTLGDAMQRRVSSLFAARRAALAVALDGIGNELLFAAARVLQDCMLADARRQGLSMAGELRSGDPGLALETQTTVLRLAEAEAIGVTASHGGMMQPLKSTSMVLGVGLALPDTQWSRCEHCPSRPRCGIAAA